MLSHFIGTGNIAIIIAVLKTHNGNKSVMSHDLCRCIILHICSRIPATFLEGNLLYPDGNKMAVKHCLPVHLFVDWDS